MTNGIKPSIGNDYGRDLGEYFGANDATVTSHVSYATASDFRLDVVEEHLGPDANRNSPFMGRSAGNPFD
ncbi:hypothetical protein [Paraburkholderia sp. J76]|uniref:hypothetical protein n=1 Tax=Paraburkholderia sp. J76 TaxID=2805439 RepID=UPI002ABE8DB2|nr:hypothetical protein [Paraburkholderia sp. J76]